MNRLDDILRQWEQSLERRHLWTTIGPFGADQSSNYRGGPLAWPIDDATLERVNAAFVRVAGAVGLPLAIVLSDEPAEEDASAFYVHYEPCADHVFALSTRELRSCLCTHDERWNKLRPEFLAVQERIDRHLRDQRIVDAVLACIDEVVVVAKLLGDHPELPG